MRFTPRANDEITIELEAIDLRFRFVPLPDPRFVSARVPHAMEGEHSTVWRVEHLQPGGAEYALKVTSPRYRQPELAAICQYVQRLKNIRGLDACDRLCLTRDNTPHTIAAFPDLEYAVLMPWIRGTSWFDAHQSHESTQSLTPWQSFRLAQAMAQVLVALESREIAHCSLSPYNMIVVPERLHVELVGVEGMLGPDFPNAVPHGTLAGYRHPTGGDRDRFFDRFPGALLLAEVLAWHDPAVAAGQHSAEYYFDPKELQCRDSRRYQVLEAAVARQHRELAALLRQAWRSDSSQECPSFAEWLERLNWVGTAKIAYTWIVGGRPEPRSEPTRRCWEMGPGASGSLRSPAPLGVDAKPSSTTGV
jgi:hypothetical protein